MIRTFIGPEFTVIALSTAASVLLALASATQGTWAFAGIPVVVVIVLWFVVGYERGRRTVAGTVAGILAVTLLSIMLTNIDY